MNDPNQHEHLNCPRCDSTNTKFCYYNNYNLSQPRHFCKNCRRYWTKGGTLRNIPVGGATRKITKRNNNRKSVMTSSPSTSSPPTQSLQVKAEGENGPGVYGFSSLMMGEPMGGFGSLLMDGLSGAADVAKDDDVLIRNPVGSEFRTGLLRMDVDHGKNEIDNGNGNGNESWNEGENVWPNLSIFTPGSSF